MTKPYLLLCLFLIANDSKFADQRAISLDDAIRRAETASPLGKAIALGIERAGAEVRASGLWPNPEVSLVREESAGTVERFANISQAIPLSGRLGFEKSAARSGLLAAEALARQERVVLRTRVRMAFVDLLLAQERLSLLEAGRSRLGRLVEILRARQREGESSGFDRMRAERELTEVEADLLDARGRQVGAGAVLGALVGLPSEELIASGSLVARDPIPGRDEVRALAASRGDIAAVEAEAERADLLARSARRRAVPEPSITAGRKTSEFGSPDDTGPVIGVAFSLPLFDRGQQSHVARTEGALLRARREALARQVEAEVEAAYAQAVARHDAEETYVNSGDPEDLIRIAQAAYEGGAMRILELLDAYRTALAIRLRTSELHAAARRAEAELTRATGAEVVR